MSKLRSDELVNKEGTGGPNFPQGVTTIDPTTDNHVATKSYVDSTVSFYGGNAISPTAPTNPATGSFWTDTSISPCVLKVWNGKDWIEFSSDVNFTGSLGSPLEVYTPFPNDGENFTYLPATDTIESTSASFVGGMLDQRNDIGLLKGREDYYTDGRPDGSTNGSGIRGIAYGKGTYVLLTGDEGVAYSTTGGTTWEIATLPDSATYWYKVIYTGDNLFGGRFVAVGGTPNKQSMWSDDGINWNLATTVPSNGYYTDVDINPATGRMVAAGVAPQISTYSGRSPYMYSDDGGENWTRSNKSYQNWQGTYAIAYGNGVWVSPGYTMSSPTNAKHYPEYSTDGINWSVVNNANNTSGGTDNIMYEGVVYNPDHGTFAAFGIGKVATTTDGANWTVSSITDDGVDYTRIAYGNGVYITAGRRGYSPVVAQQGYKITNSWLPGGQTGFGLKTMLPTKPGGTDNDASRITAMEYVDDRFVIACADGSIFLTERELPYGTLPTFTTTKEEARFINLASSSIFKSEDDSFVPNFEISDLFDGSLPVIDNGTETEIDILSVSGRAIGVPSIDGVTVGDRLKVSEPLVYGLSPDAVKFTTRNAASAIIQASDATVAFRRWTLESRVFDVDPWTVVTVADDYSPIADQDGAIPWAERPTLEENTQYRVKVEYHSSNAETITSEYQYFQTGDSTAGKLLFTEGIQIKNEQISTLSYEQTTTGVTIRLASGSFAADFEAAVGKYLEVSNSPLDVVNGFLEITSVDSGSEISGEGYITVSLAGFTPLISAGKVKTLGNVSAADPARTAGTYPGLTPTGGNGTNLEVEATVDDDGAVTVSVVNGGDNYQVNDTFTLTDEDLGGPGGIPVPAGEVEYTTAGTYTWTAPTDVTSVSVVAVGAGGGAQPYSGNGGIGAYGSGGGGGGLGWKNDIPVVPGQTYTVVVGSGGVGGISPTAGGDSYFINTSTVRGGGGDFGDTSTTSAGGTFTGDGGGNGGSGAFALDGGGSYGGGGGAGGYSGNGGNAAVNGGSHGDGSGGGGGGGFSSGGGVGLQGEGDNGTGGWLGGSGGSGGTTGQTYTTGSDGGVYGGGGGCSDNSTHEGVAAGDGGVGAVRIIWGAGRAFPSTLTADGDNGGPGAPLTFDVDSLEVDLPWSSAPNAEVRVKTLAVANTLGYVKLPLEIPGRFIESVTTVEGHTDAHVKLSSGLFTQEFEPSVGDLVEISDAVLLPNTLDPSKTQLNSGATIYRTLSEDGLTLRNVGRNFAGKSFSARGMKPNTGTYYWEVSSTTFADDNNTLTTPHAKFEVWLNDWDGNTGSGMTYTGDWRILLSQPNTSYPETDNRWQQGFIYHESSIAFRDIPHYAGERVGFEYNSNNGQLKVSFNGVVFYDQTLPFLITKEQYVCIQEGNIGNEITMHFTKDSWMYAPVDPVTYATADYLQESGIGTSNANDLWEVVHINDDQVDGPLVRVHTYAYEISNNDKHRLGAETTTEYPNQNGDSVWMQVTLPYDCTAIEFSADKGVFPGEGSRNNDNRYQPIKLYQIKINNSIISSTNYYSGTLTTDTPDMWVYRDNYAFTTHSTALWDAAHLNGYKTYSSSLDPAESDLQPLGTNTDRFSELGTMTFTPGRTIPSGRQIKLKVSTGTKITFVCGAAYPPHDGGVISIRTREPFPGGALPTADETAVTPWGAAQTGTLRIGSSTLFENLANMEAATAALLADSSEDSSGDSSSGSGDSSSGSGDSSSGSSGSGDSSGGGGGY